MKKGIFIIAEAGVNHNGCMKTAKKLIDAAKDAGANAIKFQTFSSEELATSYAEKAEYQKLSAPESKNQLQMLKPLEFGEKENVELSTYCRKMKIEFMSSPFDCKSVDLLDRIGVKRFKIPSGEITNYLLLEYIALKKKPIILSTGMSTMKEVKNAVKVFYSKGNKMIVLLHCVTEYPAPFSEINLKAMLTMQKALSLPVGYSDHTVGIEIAIAAASLGAEVIEKHLTISRTMPGPDHKASIEPNEFCRMVNNIRNVEKALGNGIKMPAKCELINIGIARRSIVASTDIRKGELFSPNNLTAKRPGAGICPGMLRSLFGKKSKLSFRKNELITN
jgi:N-acetylneuraminate synthase